MSVSPETNQAELISALDHAHKSLTNLITIIRRHDPKRRVPDGYLSEVYALMASTRQHIDLLLKR